MLEVEVLYIGGVIIPVSLLRLLTLDDFPLVPQIHITRTHRVIRWCLRW